MRALTLKEMAAVHGASANDSAEQSKLKDDGAIQSVTITGSKGDVAEAKASYYMASQAVLIGSKLAGAGANAAVQGGCNLVALSVTKVPVPAVSLVCAVGGKVAGSYVRQTVQSAGQNYVNGRF